MGGSRMSGRFGAGLCLMCVMAGLLSSCAKQREEADDSVAARDALYGVVPALERIRDRARNIVAAAPAGDWTRVYAYIKDINDAWADYKLPTVEPIPQPEPPTTILMGRLDTALARLNNAAAARDPAKTMRAANDVDAAAIDLSRFYNPDIPATQPVRAGGA